MLMTWTCLNDTPNSCKNPLFLAYMAIRTEFEAIASLATISFAEGLFDVLRATTPPSIDFFKTLSTQTLDCWAVYVIVLEKTGCRPRIYVGSATNANAGLQRRFSEYDNLHGLPKYVEASIKEGFQIVHKAPLCWIDIPSPSKVPYHRLLMIALEATFAYLLWAMKSVCKDFGMGHIALWDRFNLPWDGLCSHCCLIEMVRGDFGLTAEELEAVSAEKNWAQAQRKAEYNLNYYYDTKETDPERLQEINRTSKANIRARSPDRLNKHNKNWKRDIKASKKYFCKACKSAFASPQELEDHMLKPGHLGRARKEAKAKKQPFYCKSCIYGCQRRTHFDAHLKRPSHHKLVAASLKEEEELVEDQDSSSELD